jgi:hypothetical protein
VASTHFHPISTVIVDVTALGNDSSVTQLTLQRDSDLTKGPQPMMNAVEKHLWPCGVGRSFILLQFVHEPPSQLSHSVRILPLIIAV